MSTGATPSHARTPVMPSDLGVMRTVMAADRTLMAWIRTALSMISFGFTIYKFLESAAVVKSHPESPQRVGLFLVAVGTISMVLGTVSYWTTLKDLQRVEPFRLGRPAYYIALIISAAGATIFLAMLTRLV